MQNGKTTSTAAGQPDAAIRDRHQSALAAGQQGDLDAILGNRSPCPVAGAMGVSCSNHLPVREMASNDVRSVARPSIAFSTLAATRDTSCSAETPP